MPIPLRLLNVEDSEDDALQLVRYLSKAGYHVTFERVDTPEAMRAALSDGSWDLVVTDYTLPRFSAPAAVALLRERMLHVPVIFVSGIVPDDVMAMEAVREGAQDYLAKSYLSRLIPALGLVAGVIAEADRPAAHLTLCQEYLRLPEPCLPKAVQHGEQALAGAAEYDQLHVLAPAILSLGQCYAQLGMVDKAIWTLRRYDAIAGRLGPAEAALGGEVLLQLGLALELQGDRSAAADTVRTALSWFRARKMVIWAEECNLHLRRLAPERTEAAEPGEEIDRFSLLAGRAEYHLLTGDPGAAVTEALSALSEAEHDSLRCYTCYSLLMRCARVQGHMKDALTFALSARMMALEADHFDLAFRAGQGFTEIYRGLGPEGEAVLQQLVREYEVLGVDIARYLPNSMT
jgi:CheY-like chemotaxis protein